MSYSESWETYHQLGYMPFPIIGKDRLPTGITGRKPDITADQMHRWARSSQWRDANIALRLAGGVGIDVDDYVKGDKRKTGAADLEKLLEQFGPLPPTVLSTSRGTSTPSGIRLYRLEDPTVELKGKPAGRQGDIEIIQRHHRYAVVGRSVHPDTGKQYRWYDANRNEIDYPPPLESLPALPKAWVDSLQTNHAALDENATIVAGRDLLDDFAEGDPCGPVRRYRQEIEELDSESHIGHDAFCSLLLRGLMLGREGHVGVKPVLSDLAERFAGYLNEVGRPISELHRAARDMAETAQRKILDGRQTHGATCVAPQLSPAAESHVSSAVQTELRFFNGDKETGHRTAEIATAVAGNLDLVLAPGGQWLRHENGRWLADAETMLHRRCAQLLGSRYRGGIWQDTKALLQALHSKRVTDDEIDTFYINCPNGLLDFRTQALHPHAATVYNFNQINTEWNPAAECREFEKWGRDVFRDEDNFELAIEILGYCLLNDLPIQKAIVLIHGAGAPSGRNGKGSYLRIVESILGAHNVTAVPPQAFGEDRWAAASLYGRLANLAGDVSPQPFKDAATFKSLTGQDMVRADIKYREPIMFRNRATILASFNELPTSSDRSSGFLERWIALPFFGNFAGDRADPAVIERILESELPGILRLAVEGLNRLLARGHFRLSEASREAMSEFKINIDSVRRFLQELHDEPESTAGMLTIEPPWLCSDLYSTYRSWCEDQGYRPLGRNKFIGGVEAATDSPFGALVKVRRAKGMTLIKP